MSAESVPRILTFLSLLCYIALFFYLFRILTFILRGKTKLGTNGLREAMAMAYTIVAARLIFLSTDAIPRFVQNVLEAVGLVHVPSAGMSIGLTLCAGFVCAAFICNFSRSLWMLKSLDHAVFEPVPDWENLSAPTPKRFLEFITRTAAALLFIYIEFILEKLADSSAIDDVNLLETGGSPHNYLAEAGRIGLFLYLTLGLWWLVGLLIAKRKMPKRLFVFYMMGLIDSAFIFWYGGKVATADEAMGLLFVVGISAVAAVYMLGFVFYDILVTSALFLTKISRRKGWATSGLQPKTSP